MGERADASRSTPPRPVFVRPLLHWIAAASLGAAIALAYRGARAPRREEDPLFQPF